MSTPLRIVRAQVPQVDLIADWETWQYAQSLSGRTVNERVGAVRRWAEYAGNVPELLQHRQIVEWLANDQWAVSTRHSYYLSLAAWFRWLTLMGHRADIPDGQGGQAAPPPVGAAPH